MGARQGVALNTDECLKRKGFLDGGATCIKEECHTIKNTRRTVDLPAHTQTHTPLVRSQGSMPGGVAAMPVTEDGNFDTKYPRVLPQSCRGARDVCAHTYSLSLTHKHTHTPILLHTQMHQEAAQSALQTWHKAKNLTHGAPGNVCTQKHKHTHTSCTSSSFDTQIYLCGFISRRCFDFSVNSSVKLNALV